MNSFKIIRDGYRDKVDGEFRISPDPVSAMIRKLGEEYSELVEHRDPAEIYDILDALEELMRLLDGDRAAARAHAGKQAKWGTFRQHIEWRPPPLEGK